MKCFVLFRLKPGVTPEEYEAWFRETNVPAVRKLRSITSYRTWRVSGVMEGEPGFAFLEEMELADRDAFEAEIESAADMQAMLEGWYARVAEPLIVYADEVAQG